MILQSSTSGARADSSASGASLNSGLALLPQPREVIARVREAILVINLLPWMRGIIGHDVGGHNDVASVHVDHSPAERAI